MKSTVKQTLCLLLAAVFAVFPVRPALASGVAYMPGVTAEMCDAAYWADLQDGTRDVILTREEIQAFNQDTAAREGTMVMDLRGGGGTFDGLRQNADIRASATSDAEHYSGWTYTGDGEEATWDYYEAMIENCVDPTATESMPVRYGIAVRRTLLRVFPSPNPILDDPNDPDFDYQALSGVRVNEPLLIYTTSADGKYYLARASGCSGWAPVEDVALCAGKDEWLSAWDLPSDKLLVVCGNKEYTDASNSTPETACRMLTQGTALELAADLAPDQLIGNRSPFHNYVVYLPVRRDDGTYEKQMALIPQTAKVSVGYLPLTMENVAMVALNNLGDAYGWGGMLNVEDCSGLIRTVYACFGLNIARNGTWQGNMNIEKIDMTDMSLEEKRLILDEMPLGSALCFDGHEMMYLGKAGGKYYVVSTVSSIVSPATGSALRTRDVMINTLDVKRGSGKTWLGDLNMAFMPCYAKLEGKTYDFPALQPYHDAVAYCLHNGVLPALDIDGTFGVGQDATWGDLARALWTLAGSPDGGEPPAADTDAADGTGEIPACITWATQTGVLAGEADSFPAEDAVSYQDVLMAMGRLAGSGSAAGDGQAALQWARDAGVVPDADGEPSLSGPVARENLAELLFRYGQLPEVQALLPPPLAEENAAA